MTQLTRADIEALAALEKAATPGDEFECVSLQGATGLLWTVGATEPMLEAFDAELGTPAPDTALRGEGGGDGD